MIIVGLIYNLSILVSLSVFSGFIDAKFKRTELPGKALQGLLFGLVSVIGMVFPFVYSEEILFDGRSIVLSLCALFFGHVPALIASVMAAVCRIYLGGSGVIHGIILIFVSSLIGILFYNWNKKLQFNKLTPSKLYLFGILVHLAMIINVSIFPDESFLESFQGVVLTILGVYPLITLVAGKVLLDQERNAKYINEISEREELFRTTLYSIGDAVITTDINGKIQQINHVAEQITGWKEEDAKEKPLNEVFKIQNETTKQQMESPVDKILKDGKIVGLANHTILISKNGDEIPIADSGAPIRDINGKIAGVVLVFRDQTKERHSQKVLLESEEIFKQFMKYSPIYVFFKDENIRSIRLSDNYEKMLGIPVQKLLGKNMFELFPSDLAAKMIEDDKRILNEGKVIEVQEEFNGRIYTTIKFPIRIEGKPAYLAGFTIDITESKKAEKDLREALELQKVILDNASYVIFSTNPKGIIQTFNPAAEKMTGYSAAEIVNKHTPEIFHDPVEIFEYAKTLSEELGETIHPGFQVFCAKATRKLANEHEWTFIRKDETRVPVLLSVSVLYDNSGNISGFLGIANDISERKDADRLLKIRTLELKESEEKYRTLFEQSKDAMLIIDNNIFVDCNDAALNMLKFKFKKELLNTHPSELSPSVQPDGRLSYEKAEEMMNIAKEKGSHKFEWVHRKADGEDFFVEVFLTIIPYRKRQIIHTAWRDITDRKKAEEKILTLSKGVEQSPATIIISNKEGNIEYVNPKFTEVTGYAFEEVYNKKLELLKFGRYDDKTYRELQEAVTKGIMWKGELLNRKKNGELFWEQVSISPLRNENGDITNFIAVKEDISERKKMMEDLIVSKEKAEKANQLKSEFLAQMSHEIRSPINTMVSFTSLIEEELRSESNEELDVCFTGIESASKRVIRTIDLILNMSELQLGTYEVSPREINLSDVLYNLLIEYMKVASAKHLELNLDIDSENIIVNTDEYAVNQIFANLLDNAIKYTEKGKVDIFLSAGKDKTIIKVSDTGIGISTEYLDKLFEPFSQEEQGYSRRFEGNGLGMALVKRYCDLINAEITVGSEKGKGTVFTVVLPK